MTLEAYPDKQNNCLVYVLKGVLNKQMLKPILSQMVTCCRQKNLKRILIDMKAATNSISPFDLCTLAYHDLSKLNISYSVSIVLLISSEDSSHNFLETVLRNASYKVKLFHDREAALDWLLS